MSKKNSRTPDFDGDFSFLGQPAAQGEPAEPAAELPVIAPVVTPAAKPAAKPVAAKAAIPPLQAPPPTPPQAAAPAPPAAITPPAAPAPPAASPPAAASKRGRSSVDIPVDFSFLGQPAAQNEPAEPIVELPVIASVVTPAISLADEPVVAEPAALSSLSPPQATVSSPPAATAPSAEEAHVAPVFDHSSPSADKPADLTFLEHPAAQPPAEEWIAEMPEISASAASVPDFGAHEADAVPLLTATPQLVAPAELLSPAPLESDTASGEFENESQIESRIETLIEALEEPSEIPSLDQSTVMLPDTSDSESEWVEEGTQPAFIAEKDAMNKRSGPSSDFSGDFSFLNNSPETSQALPELSETSQSASSFEPEGPASADDDEANVAVVAAAAPSAPPVAAATGRPGTAKAAEKADPLEGDSEASAVPTRRANTIAVPAWFPGYTAALTLIVLFLLLTGRIHVSSNHVLESLPDVRPLAANEFQEVKASQKLPKGHMLALGESRRFGDVVVTPLKVTKEPLQFEDFLTGKPVPSLTTSPALKLHLRFENVSGGMAFPPWDAALMSHRFPPFTNDLNTLANSFLSQVSEPADEFPERLLNYLQTMDSNFVLTGQNAGRVVAPGETLETWIASEPIPDDWHPEGQLRWRVQFRKGVNRASGNGVTTLIDVNFQVSDISG
ncbi:MAG: hypothetical protein ACKO2P_15880 [Planctomycetota bacterium]